MLPIEELIASKSLLGPEVKQCLRVQKKSEFLTHTDG